LTPTAVLREEHRVILKALDVLEAAAGRLAAGEGVSDESWQALLDWLRVFADARHHAKEEHLLFPAMIRAGLPAEGGPVDVMLEEHTLGRALVAAMAEGAPIHRASQARHYVRVLRDHIDKEHLVVFPLAEDVLDGAEVGRLTREFETYDLAQGRGWSIAAAEARLDALASARTGGGIPPAPLLTTPG
jgi:hemerythrin-like domain-containing protein